jgi:hypothetical protein
MQTLIRLRPKFLLLLLSIFFTLLFYSCKKTESFAEPSDWVQKENLAEKFFATKTATTKEIASIIEQLKKENASSDFINKLPANIGLPVWDKVVLQKEKIPTDGFGISIGSNSSTADIILPLTTNNTGLSGILMAHPITDGYTISSYTIDQLYSVCHGNNIDTVRAKRELVLFFYLENQVFGTTKFYHIPAKLFPKSKQLDADGNKTITIFPVSKNNGGVTSLLEICIKTYGCPYPAGGCTGPNGTCDGCLEICAAEDCIEISGGGTGGGPTGGGPTGGGGGSPTGGGPTGGGGGGGSPTGGGGGTPPPCPGSVWYGILPGGSPCPNVPPPPGAGHGWNPNAPGDKLCSVSFNLRVSADNSFYETNMTGLKFEDAAGNVNTFSAFFDIHNGMTNLTMNTLVYPNPFPAGVPQKTALEYLTDVFPDLFSGGDITSVVESGQLVWRFSRYAAQKIVNRCSNLAGLDVSIEQMGSCAIPGNIVAQIAFRTKAQAYLRAFMPTSVCRQAPSQSTNTSIASYSPLCN